MTPYVDQPGSGELEDGERDQIVGGEAKKAATKREQRKKTTADDLAIEQTNETPISC